MLNRRPWGPLCWVLAFFTASYQHLLWTPTHQGLKAPSAWCGFPYHISSITPAPTLLQLCLLSWLSYIIVRRTTQSPTRSLESHEWSSLSGNNSHAVHRSLSSGASVYDCTMGIFLPRPISSANLRPCDFLSKLPLECVISFRCITLEWHFWPGRRSKYNNLPLIIFQNSTRGIFSSSSPSPSHIFYRIIYKDNNDWKHKKNHLNYSKQNIT